MTTTLISPNESFLSEGVILTCKVATNGCVGCSRIGTTDCDRLLCSSVHRSDFKSVIFVESKPELIGGLLVERVMNQGCGRCAFSDRDEQLEPCSGCDMKTMYKRVGRVN